MGADCPVVRQYVPRLNELNAEFQPLGIKFLAIFSNARDNVLAMANYVCETDLAIAAFSDGQHRLADLLHAQVMSEVVVLNPSFEVHYQGAIDDQFKKTSKRGHATENYLADALRELLDNKPATLSITPASGCHIERNDPIRPNDQLTFYKDIAPLLQKNCQTCHRAGEVGPFEFFTSETTMWRIMPRPSKRSYSIAECHRGTESLIRKSASFTMTSDWPMPTSKHSCRGFAPTCRKASHRRAESGNLAIPSAWSIGNPDFVYRMDKPFTVPATGVLNYQFFRVHLNLKADRWIQAIEVRPGNREVVHHIGMHITPASNDDFSGLGMAVLFGLSGDLSTPLNDYVPGDLCNHKQYPSGRAVRIPANSDLIFEVHYTPNGSVTSDRSEVAMRWAKEAPAEEVHTKVFRLRARRVCYSRR